MNAELSSPLGKTALEGMVLTIGSSPDNSLVINDVKVSAHHAEIHPEGQSYSITDLGSIHGTYVNSQRLDWNTAHLLTPGSTITIGDTTFTYEEGNAEPLALPSQETGDNAAYTLPQGYAQPYAAAPLPGYTLPPKRSRRRWIWISLIIVLLLIIAGGTAAILYFTRATPEKTVDTYCNDLRGLDYRGAYNLLSSSLQKSAGTEAEFAAKQEAMGRTTTCTHDSANVTGNLATTDLTLISGGQSYTGIISLAQASGNWQISVLLSSPQLTLTIFCNALRTGDTHTAYNEYSQNLKNANSETKFAQTFKGVGCIFSSINTSGNAGTASIVFVNAQGPTTPYVVLLVQDPANNSDWRIEGIQVG